MVVKRTILKSLLLFYILMLPLWSQAEENRLIYRVKKTTANIKIDGHITEKAWEHALVLPVNNEFMPGENVESPVRTQCLILYNNSYLYVGFKAYDPHANRIRAHLSDHDNVASDDYVAIVLDTFNDQNRAFVFFCNPLGVQMDELFSDGGEVEDISWDAIWYSAGHINDKGYEVEMAIPFRELQFQRSKKAQTWGFAVMRNWPRSQLHQSTNFLHNRSNSCFLCQFHKLEGIEGVSPGRDIELDPTFTAHQTHARENFPGSPMEKADPELDVGISGHWGFTPNLTLSATVNPDFSQVEADVVQLDVNTQFTLQYPEKRPFFLEGIDFFSTRINGVHTRTLIDPSWGVKVSGKEGKNAIGLFVSRDEITYLLFPGAEESEDTILDQGSTAAVLRYRRDIGKSSTLGFLITDREGKNYYNRLAGVDGLFRISESDTIRFQVLGSSTRYPDEIAGQYRQSTDNLTGYAAFFSYLHHTRAYGWKLIYKDFSPDFRSDLGFIPQVNYRTGIIEGNYIYWGNQGEFLTLLEAKGEVHQTQDHQGNLLEREARVSVELDMPLQSVFILTAGTRKKVFNSLIFNQDFLYIFFKIQPTGGIYLNCRVNIGDEVDYIHARPGKHFLIEPKTTLRFGKHLYMSLSYSYSHLNLEQGRLYSAHVLQNRLVYYFSKRAFLRGIIQYTDISLNPALYPNGVDPVSRKLFTQFLFSYKINPRTVLFLGYSDTHQGLVDIDLTQTNRTFFLKIGYALTL
jgi:hypothetical protein